jgi:hypothetical protein
MEAEINFRSAVSRRLRPASASSKQLWQPREVDGDPARLVFREHFCLPGFGLVLARVEVRNCLAVTGASAVPRLPVAHHRAL